MKTCLVLLLALTSTAFAGGAKAKPKTAPVKVELADGTGKAVGTATLTASSKGVSIKLDVHDLTPGEHAIHVHATPKCDGPDFKSAGGHFNPDNKKHGMKAEGGAHAGDMPNFTVGKDGKSKATVVAPGVTLGDDAHSVFSGEGTALVIHAKADDMKTDPAGNAGDRIACGVIAKPAAAAAGAGTGSGAGSAAKK